MQPRVISGAVAKPTLKNRFKVKSKIFLSLEKRMIDVAEFTESFKKISKRLDRHEESFHDIELFHIEIKKRLRGLELARNRSDEYKGIELQQAKNILFFIFYWALLNLFSNLFRYSLKRVRC